MANSGEYDIDIFNSTGIKTPWHGGDIVGFRNEIMHEVTTMLTNYLNAKRQEGWVIVEIKKPEVKITEPPPGQTDYTYNSDTFILWQRKPLATAIFGE